MNNSPLVSVFVMTYNHKDFIVECLESILMQNVDFPYEIVIGEDRSPDGTREICKRYAKEHPNLIRLLDGEKNLGMKGNAERTLSACRGKYIASCEGDDFWTDTLKLQKQVDFMEEHEDYAMIFSNTSVKIEAEGTATNLDRGLVEIKESRAYTDIEIFENWMVPSNTVFFRRVALNETYFKLVADDRFIYPDIVFNLYLSSIGKLYGMKDYTATYRRHEGGITNNEKSIAFDKRYYSHLLAVINEFGAQLKTPKIKRALSRLSLSIGLSNLSEKKYSQGLKLLAASLSYDKSAFFKYLKSKF